MIHQCQSLFQSHTIQSIAALFLLQYWVVLGDSEFREGIIINVVVVLLLSLDVNVSDDII